MKTLKLTFLACFFGAGMLFAQKAEEPQHAYDMGGKIEMMTLTDSGVLVVNGRGGLSGIKPGASSPHFTFKDYGNVKAEEMEYIPMTPYIVITQEKMMSTNKSIVDIVSGKVLFASEENEWRLVDRLDVIMPNNVAVVSGDLKGGKKGLKIYDLDTGKEEHYVEFYDGKTTTTLNRIPKASGEPVLIDGGLLYPSTRGLYRINLETGSVVWMNEDLKNVSSLTSDDMGKEIYTFEDRTKHTRVHKVSSDGKALWNKEIKVPGEVTRFQILPNGLAVVSDVVKSGSTVFSGNSESKIAFLSAADGSDLWDKAPKTKGFVQHFYVMDDGILFGLYDGGINKISFDGKTLFKKPLKTGANIHTMALTPKGMIYITDSDADIINLTTGESVWDKPLKYKNAGVVTSDYDSKNDRYLICTGNEIKGIHGSSGEVNTLASIKFDGKESVTNMMVREDGILVTSNQNVQLFDFDGDSKYHSYYQAPGKSTGGKILAGVGGLAAAAAGTAVTSSQVYSYGSRATNSYQIDQYAARVDRTANAYAGLAAASFVEMSRRFSATAATENFQFILTKLDNNDVGLIKVDKKTGSPVKEISLRDKKPEYEVDEIGGFLYYQATNSTIYSYDLNK